MHCIPEEGTKETFDINNTRHTTFESRANTNFTKLFFNNQLNKFVFELPDDDPNKATAEYIIDGYDEAVKKGYKFGLTDYARKDILIILYPQCLE